MQYANGALTVVGSGLDCPVILLSDTGTWATEAVGHRVIGRRGVLPATGVRRHRTGTLRVACPSDASWRALRTILDTGRTLDLTSDCLTVAPARLMVTEVSQSWLVEGGSVRVIDLQYEAVTEDPPQVHSDWDWQAVKDGYTDWTALWAAYSAWAGVLARLEGSGGVGW